MTPLPGWPGENRWLGPLSWYWLRWGETSSPQGSPKKDGVHYSFKKITFHLKSLSASLHLEGQGLDRFEVPHVFRIGASWIVWFWICFDSGVNLLRSGSATETSQFPIIAGAPFQDGHDELMLTEYVVTRYYRAPEAQSQPLERFTSPPVQSLELGQVVLTASKYTYATALRCCILFFLTLFFSRSWMGMWNNVDEWRVTVVALAPHVSDRQPFHILEHGPWGGRYVVSWMHPRRDAHTQALPNQSPSPM